MLAKPIDYRRLIRVICDILAVGTGAFCFYGAMSTPASNVNLLALKLLGLFGACVGVLVGCTEKSLTRRLAVLLTIGMSLLHLYLHYVLWQLGLSVEVAEPMGLVAIPVIILGVALATDGLARGRCHRVERTKPILLWTLADDWVRLLAAFMAAFKCLGLALFLWMGPAGTKSSLLGFVVGCHLTALMATFWTYVVWRLTDPSVVDSDMATSNIDSPSPQGV